ncbi:hypothetical protein EA472_09265 [Natrarchaeobius oligotrophus]|uniref:Uncharacterized protein n=1 Tax=Natrarchaeobius chitinivorans TaxID=1679083 RepID=A0A3N6MI52_NATCH|nr:hypothetical protein EA472_09265 [Natrarchaeobius chitinivorans]
MGGENRPTRSGSKSRTEHDRIGVGRIEPPCFAWSCQFLKIDPGAILAVRAVAGSSTTPDRGERSV